MSEYIITCDEETASWIGNDVESMQGIVRCGDCLHWARGYCHKHAYDVTNEYGDEFTEGAFPMGGADFCSLGERREADDGRD